MKNIIQLLILSLSIYSSQAQDFSAYKKALFIRKGDTLRYRILYPENYNREKAYPLVVYLHGGGDRGNDNEHQLQFGGTLFLRGDLRKRFPAIVVFPQCPVDSTWNRFTKMTDTTTPDVRNRSLNTYGLTTPERLVKLLMDHLVQKGIVDKRRIYLGGNSMGGFGTYDLVIHYPDYFAATFPICGQANVKVYTEKGARVPVWIFHGALDKDISPQPDRNLFKALQAIGVKHAKYTEYPNLKHNCWDTALAEPGLLPWLFSFQK